MITLVLSTSVGEDIKTYIQGFKNTKNEAKLQLSPPIRSPFLSCNDGLLIEVAFLEGGQQYSSISVHLESRGWPLIGMVLYLFVILPIVLFVLNLWLLITLLSSSIFSYKRETTVPQGNHHFRERIVCNVCSVKPSGLCVG